MSHLLATPYQPPLRRHGRSGHGMGVNQLTGKPLTFGNHAKLNYGLKLAEAYVPNSFQAFGRRLNEGLGKKFFRPIVEDFLMGIMAVDFFALWLPRAWAALMRGVMDYDPQKDPEAQTKEGWNEKLYVAKERFKRLNWPNFFEEWWREFASGPGMFIWPTLCFAAFRNSTDNRRAIQTPQFTLKQLSKQFKQFVADNPTTDKHGGYNKFAESLIDWDRLFGNRIMDDASKQKRSDYRQHLANNLSKLTEKLTERAKLQDKHPLANLPLHRQRRTFRKLTEAIHKINGELKDTIRNINTRYAGERYMKHFDVPLTSAWEAGNTGKPATTIGNFTAQLEHFFDLAHNTKKRAIKTKKPLATTVEQLTKKALRHKGWFSLATIGITLGFLFKLVEWTQSNDTYVANRTQKLEDLFGVDKKPDENSVSATVPASVTVGAAPLQGGRIGQAQWPSSSPLPYSTTSQVLLPYQPVHYQGAAQ